MAGISTAKVSHRGETNLPSELHWIEVGGPPVHHVALVLQRMPCCGRRSRGTPLWPISSVSTSTLNIGANSLIELVVVKFVVIQLVVVKFIRGTCSLLRGRSTV